MRSKKDRHFLMQHNKKEVKSFDCAYSTYMLQTSARLAFKTTFSCVNHYFSLFLLSFSIPFSLFIVLILSYWSGICLCAEDYHKTYTLFKSSKYGISRAYVIHRHFYVDACRKKIYKMHC